MSPEAINNMYDPSVGIIPASDVFQLSAVFWYVVNKRYPLGIVTKEDWLNEDEKTCELLLRSLSFNHKQRPQNGQELFDGFMTVRKIYEEQMVI